MLVHRQHIFESERFEVQPVAGVVIGRDRLRIAVDHDGFVIVIAERKRRMAAAVIELDALANAVRPAAQNNDFASRRRRGFIFLFVGGVEVRRIAIELGRAGVHFLEYRRDAVAPPQFPDRDPLHAGHRGSILRRSWHRRCPFA